MLKNMKNRLFFSICVPVYNVEKYLCDCIESVLNQSYGQFELVLVDDGSTDNSYQICQDYQSKDSRVKAFTKENGGQISAREFAFDHVSGDVILCLDSDDYIENDTLDKLNDYFTKENPDCIYFNWQRVCNDRVLSSKKEIKSVEKINDISRILKKVCSNSFFNSMCTKAFRKELLPKRKLVDFYNVRHGEDLVQTLDILEFAKTVLFVPDVFYNYRVNFDSISYNINLEKSYVESSVRYYVYLFLKKKNFFSKKDWSDYGMYCAEKLYKNVCIISVAQISFLKKKEYFEIIRNSQYYREFLYRLRSNNFMKNIFIFLFEKRIDFLVVLFFTFLKRVRNWR